MSLSVNTSQVLQAVQMIEEKEKVFDKKTKVKLLNRAGGLTDSVSRNLARRSEIKRLMEYLHDSPTTWHAVLSAKKMCVKKNGFKELSENNPWNVKPGGKYFLNRNKSSFIAFVMPKKMPKSVCILGAHTDSPGLKLKPNPEKRVDNVTLLCPEVYGGPVLSSWFDRSLSLAGRITYLDKGGKKQTSLVDLKKTIGTISNVAIHLEHSLGNKLEINRQDHLPAVCWIQTRDERSTSFLEKELKKIVPFTKLLSHELFFIPQEAPEIVLNQQVHSAKLDNLLGTQASLDALLGAQDPEEDRIKMIVAWDSEEVGSKTYQGAASNFLPETLKRITKLSGMSQEQYSMMIAKSGLISIDVAHARHPNYYSKHEPNHAPLLGKGPVIKFHANQSYATNIDTSSWIKMAGLKTDVPIQEFCIRSDTRCGSTIGNIVAPKLGIRTVDIGVPILGMHSIREKGHLLDHVYMVKLLKHLLSMELV